MDAGTRGLPSGRGLPVRSDLGLAVVRLVIVVHLGEVPFELKLDLFFVVLALVLDAEAAPFGTRTRSPATRMRNGLSASRASANRRSFAVNWSTE